MTNEELVTNLLINLGLDITNRNLVDTPKRFCKVLEQFAGFGIDFESEYKKLSEAVFPHDGENMITANAIKVFSLCPHHLLPVQFSVSIAYLPHGWVIGLSKLARFAKLCARRLDLQEDYTRNLGLTLQDWLKTKDVAVLVKGKHMCMEMRGVEVSCEIVTSEVLGAFRKDPSVRNEFHRLISNGKS